MYKVPKPAKTTMRINNSVEGESIEKKIERIVNNNEPIEDGAPLVYTDRKDGIPPEFNIRTDRFEIAVEATDVITKGKIAKREERIKGSEATDTTGEQAPPQE